MGGLCCLYPAFERQAFGALLRGLESGEHGGSPARWEISGAVPAANQVELFVDNPEIDCGKDRGWLHEPVRPLRL